VVLPSISSALSPVTLCSGDGGLTAANERPADRGRGAARRPQQNQMEAAPERRVASAVADSGENRQQMEAAPKRRDRIRGSRQWREQPGSWVLNVDRRSEEDAD
jgi:hypothetical protein